MVDYLDPEIAGEGIPAETSWSPAVEKPRIPTYEGIKSIAKYFPQFTGRPYQHQAYPCWLYHSVHGAREVRDILTGEDPPRIVKRASEIAKELGCVFRPSSMEEKAQGWPSHRWEYTGEWRATPFSVKFDPSKPDTGKHVVSSRESSSQNVSADLIAATVAAVLAGQQHAPNSESDPAWLEFQAFKAWKNSVDEDAAADNALNASTERHTLEEEARAKGVKVDGRWSAARLKEEIEKV